MATYAEMVRQIEQLKKDAESARKVEIASVVKTIKKQISDYNLTAHDLGLTGESHKPKAKERQSTSKGARGKRAGLRSGAGRKVPPKCRDESGNSWTGRGKKPLWFVQALAMGRTLESLLIK